eukprot:jgi/Botrbrau1/21661/Bobra.43_1s0060.2
MEPLSELKNLEGRGSQEPRSASREKALAKGERTFQEFKQRRLRHRLSRASPASELKENDQSSFRNPLVQSPSLERAPFLTPRTGGSSCSNSTVAHLSFATPVPIVFQTGICTPQSCVPTALPLVTANNSGTGLAPYHQSPGNGEMRSLDLNGSISLNSPNLQVVTDKSLPGEAPKLQRPSSPFLPLPSVKDITKLMETHALMTPAGEPPLHLSVGTPRTGATVRACPLFDPVSTPPGSAFGSPVEGPHSGQETLPCCKSAEPLRHMTYTRCALFSESCPGSPQGMAPVGSSPADVDDPGLAEDVPLALLSPNTVMEQIVHEDGGGKTFPLHSSNRGRTQLQPTREGSQDLPTDAQRKGTATAIALEPRADFGFPVPDTNDTCQPPILARSEGPFTPLPKPVPGPQIATALSKEDQSLKGEHVTSPRLAPQKAASTACSSTEEKGELLRLKQARQVQVLEAPASSPGEKTPEAGKGPAPALSLVDALMPKPEAGLASEPVAAASGDGSKAPAEKRVNQHPVVLPIQARPSLGPSDWVAMDCDAGPSMSLLFENQCMRAEREELKRELRTISERLAAIEERTKSWPKGPPGGKGRSHSLPRLLQYKRRPVPSSCTHPPQTPVTPSLYTGTSEPGDDSPESSFSDAQPRNLKSSGPQTLQNKGLRLGSSPSVGTGSLRDPISSGTQALDPAAGPRRGRSRSRGVPARAASMDSRTLTAERRRIQGAATHVASTAHDYGQGLPEGSATLNDPPGQTFGVPGDRQHLATIMERGSSGRAPSAKLQGRTSLSRGPAARPLRGPPIAGASALARAQALLEQIGNVGGDRTRRSAGYLPLGPTSSAQNVPLQARSASAAEKKGGQSGWARSPRRSRSRPRTGAENIDPARCGA